MVSQFPAPPVEMVMPQVANQIFTVANLAILAIFAIVLGRECVRSRSPLPLPIVPLAGLAGGAAVGFPMWWALNSGAGSTATLLATFVVFAIACLVLHVYTSLACVPAADSLSTAKQPPVATATS